MASVLRGDSRSISSAAWSPVALLTPCGITITRPPVEDEHKRQFELPNDREEPWRLAGGRVDQALSRLEAVSPDAEFTEEDVGHARRQQGRMVAVGKVDDRTVFGDDAVHEVKVAGDAPQLDEESGRSPAAR